MSHRPAKQTDATLNPKTTEFEWGGPNVSSGMIIALPLLVVYLNALCSADSCSVWNVTLVPHLFNGMLDEARPKLLLAFVVVVLWIAFHCVFWMLPIGERVTGVTLRNGQRLVYHMNAIHAFVFCHAVAFVGHQGGFFNLGNLADFYTPLMLASIIFSFLFSIFLYVFSFRRSSVLLALGGNSGEMLYDFWIGRELNPRLGDLDFKFIFELRPGLIGWSLLNWAFAVKGNLNPAVVLVSIFESWYVIDGLLLEAGNLTMMDIVYDGFGFMLCFGDLAWVPFVYTLKAKYLAYHFAESRSDFMYLALCAGLHIIGYAVFRGSNSQKDAFRKNPKDPKLGYLKVMRTSTGSSLIVNGFWGICRHPNYVGDWFMTTAWCALTGTNVIVTYFQAIYFAILLIHRQLRDEHQMRNKYGEDDWNAFCTAVPYRLIPYIY